MSTCLQAELLAGGTDGVEPTSRRLAAAAEPRASGSAATRARSCAERRSRLGRLDRRARDRPRRGRVRRGARARENRRRPGPGDRPYWPQLDRHAGAGQDRVSTPCVSACRASGRTRKQALSRLPPKSSRRVPTRPCETELAMARSLANATFAQNLYPTLAPTWVSPGLMWVQKLACEMCSMLAMRSQCSLNW